MEVDRAPPGCRLSEEIRTLAEVLAAKGYRTAAVIASFVLDRRFGLMQGFDFYDDDSSEMRALTADSDPFDRST
jgi:arylsulfatase A-like enzyme